MSRRDVALDAAVRGVASLQRRSVRLQRWYVPIAAAGLTLLAIVAVFAMQSSTPNYDPQYMRVLVERAMHTGDSYYASGIHNKGPLEPFVYELAGQLGGPDGWWFVISFFTLCAALAVGLTAGVVTVRCGGTRLLAACVVTMAVVHLTLSDADYAGVLYARNLTTALISAALAIAAFDPWWRSERSRRWAAIAVGLAAGLAVQTLMTSCFTASPVLLWAMWHRRRDGVLGRPAWLIMPAVAALALLSAPVFYLLSGSWQDFVDGFWTQARYMSTGTGRSLGSQFGLGVDRFRSYYADRWPVAALLVLGPVVSAVRWRRLDPNVRALRLAIALWWVGAWIEMILSQRYSSHYFSILAVPTIMVIAVLTGDAGRLFARLRAGRPSFALLPLVVAVVTIQVGGQTAFDVGVDAAATVTSTQEFTARRERGIDGRTRMVRATLDLVSERGDPILIWTSYPWPYLNLRRTSATRYIWKTFLLGEIYLGEHGPEYVLPGTWERFAADLDRSDPTAYLVESVNPIDPSTPFRTAVDERFTDVYGDDTLTFGFRNDLARWLVRPAPGGTELPSIDEGPYTASTDACVRIDGVLPSDTSTSLRVDMIQRGGSGASLVATVADGAVRVDSNVVGVDGHVAEIAVEDDSIPVSIIVGARSAVMVVGGSVGGAVEIDPDTTVTVTSGIEQLTFAGAAVSRPPAFTGC